MTINEFILLDKHKVRRDSNLMYLYLEFFKEAFGRVPSCAGCSFGTDWAKLVAKYSKNYVTLQKAKTMSKSITIKKIQGKILSYKKDGKTYRLYDNILNDSFIKEYISNGTDEEIAERKKMFNFPSEDEIIEKLQKDTAIELDKRNEETYSLNISKEQADVFNDALKIEKPAVKKRGKKAKNG